MTLVGLVQEVRSHTARCALATIRRGGPYSSKCVVVFGEEVQGL